jgi:cytidylate kinase
MPNARAVMPEENKMRWRAVTISREMGTGGHPVADAIAEHLHTHSGEGAQSWMIFDRNLVEKVLEEHNLPPRLAKFMLEDRITGLDDTLDELFGLHPSTWTLVEKTAETILRLVEMGHVIIIGRGGNIITSRLNYVFHVRLVAPLEARVEIVQRERHLDKKAAMEMIHREDEGRRRYVKKYFHKDIDDPLLYHLVINTAVVGDANAGRLIGDAMLASAGITHH